MSTPTKYTVTIHGEQLSLSEASAKYNILYYTLYQRYKSGVRGDALLKPRKVGRRRNRPSTSKYFGTVDGETMSLKQLAAKYNVPYATILTRYRNGLRDTQLILDQHPGRKPKRDKQNKLGYSLIDVVAKWAP